MASLGPSVSSLRSSISLLESSINLLDNSVSDFPRLRKVLSTQQHFELLPEPTLRAAQESILDEITPAITGLLGTAEAHIVQLGRREESLRARSELLEGRLENDRRRRKSSLGDAQAQIQGSQNLGGGLTDPKTLELKRLRQRKERLQYTVDRLELESKQRERELRKSMAVVNNWSAYGRSFPQENGL
jgi:DASH complex subunit SPC19